MRRDHGDAEQQWRDIADRLELPDPVRGGAGPTMRREEHPAPRLPEDVTLEHLRRGECRADSYTDVLVLLESYREVLRRLWHREQDRMVVDDEVVARVDEVVTARINEVEAGWRKTQPHSLFTLWLALAAPQWCDPARLHDVPLAQADQSLTAWRAMISPPLARFSPTAARNRLSSYARATTRPVDRALDQMRAAWNRDDNDTVISVLTPPSEYENPALFETTVGLLSVDSDVLEAWGRVPVLVPRLLAHALLEAERTQLDLLTPDDVDQPRQLDEAIRRGAAVLRRPVAAA